MAHPNLTPAARRAQRLAAAGVLAATALAVVAQPSPQGPADRPSAEVVEATADTATPPFAGRPAGPVGPRAPEPAAGLGSIADLLSPEPGAAVQVEAPDWTAAWSDAAGSTVVVAAGTPPVVVPSGPRSPNPSADLPVGGPGIPDSRPPAPDADDVADASEEADSSSSGPIRDGGEDPAATPPAPPAPEPPPPPAPTPPPPADPTNPSPPPPGPVETVVDDVADAVPAPAPIEDAAGDAAAAADDIIEPVAPTAPVPPPAPVEPPPAPAPMPVPAPDPAPAPTIAAPEPPVTAPVPDVGLTG